MTDSSPVLSSDFQRVGRGVSFGKNVSIVAKSVEIGDFVTFRDDISISCRGSLKIGHHGIIGSGARIQCNNLTIGDWLYACDGLEIGAGGCNSKDSNVTIGNRVGIFERVLINPNSEVKIGDNCGIGREVQIWTHGAWLDPLSGYPSDFGPVSVGNNVWLPARCIILPNVSIGDNCVIGINSIINKSIPSGTLAAGCPVKILKADAYPRVMSDQQCADVVKKIISDWSVEIEYKIPDLSYSVELTEESTISLVTEEGETVFDLTNKTVHGVVDAISEDCRDFLRRRGIKIYTDDFFKSV